MNEKALQTLEYHKIIDRLTELAGSVPGKELCRNLVPLDNLEEIRQMQRETSDASARLFRKGSISFSGVTDLRGTLRRLEVGSSMNIDELLRTARLLEVCLRVKTWGRPANEAEEPDSLTAMFDALTPESRVASEIRRCILSEDEISDDASAGLRQVRRAMKTANDRIHSQLTGLLSGSSRMYLQDAVITQRNGRYCVPVKAEYRGQVPGMI